MYIYIIMCIKWHFSSLSFTQMRKCRDFKNEKDIYEVNDMIKISWNISTIWHPVWTDKMENWIFLSRNVDIDFKSLFCVKCWKWLLFKMSFVIYETVAFWQSCLSSFETRNFFFERFFCNERIFDLCWNHCIPCQILKKRSVSRHWIESKAFAYSTQKDANLLCNWKVKIEL